MNNLTKYALSDLYDIASGISSTKEQAGHGAPFLSFSTVFNNFFLPSELPDLMETSLKEQEIFSIKEGDVFFTRTSETVDELAMSSVALKSYPCATFSGFLKRLRPKKEGLAYPKFMAFYFRSSYFRKLIDCNTIMTLRASFNEDIFSFLNIYLPNHSVQKKVGDFLFCLEAKMQQNARINDNLEQQLRTIYDYWFTQFDFPDEKGKPYRSSGGKMVWNEELKREIPEGWSVASIISNPLSTVIKPGVTRFDKKTYFATADVDGRNILDGTLIAFEGRESRANMQPTINSIWFAKMKNSIKHLILNAEMKELIDNSVLSTGFFGLQVQEDAFEYIASFIRSGYFENRKDILAHGATQEAVNNDDLGTLYFVIPDAKTLQVFHKTTKGIYAKMSHNIIENRKLSKLRDWLLPMLMNGQATVAD